MAETGTKDDVIPYVYEPLPKGADYFIRLMHLKPALQPEAPLHFTFTSNEIGSLIAQYEAISYTWGGFVFECPLQVDGACMLVTKNLNRALRGLRHPTNSRTLWVDAICINQTDDEEKSRQIPLMSQIYRDASRVVAWLDGGAEEERGMQMLNLLSRPPQWIWHESTAYYRLLQNGFSSRLISQFLNLAWFTRLWIVQEVVLNTDVILLCGSSEISWLRFNIALRKLRNFEEKDSSIQDTYDLAGLQKMTQLWETHSLIQQQDLFGRPRHNESILELINNFYSHRCTDDRDRIFALSSMTADIRRRADGPTLHTGSESSYDLPTDDTRPVPVYLDVDYALDVRQTYQKFAAACIASDRGAQILYEVFRRPSSTHSHQENWPSWVPDWRLPPHATGPWKADDHPWAKYIRTHYINSDIMGVTAGGHVPFTLVVDCITPAFGEEDMLDIASALRLHLAHMPSSIFDLFHWLIFCQFQVEEIVEYIEGTYEEKYEARTTLQCALEDAVRDRRFFVASRPGFAHVVGHSDGSLPLANGDELVYPVTKRIFDEEAAAGKSMYHFREALLVRRQAMRSGIEERNVPTYRLVGTVGFKLPRFQLYFQQQLESQDKYQEECDMIYLE